MRGIPNSIKYSTPSADVLTLFLEAALADRNWPEARRRAWQLYLTQLAETSPKPQTWTAARRRLQEDTNSRDLSPEARVDIARALCHQPHLDQEQDAARVAVDLCLANLNSHASGPDARRTYQASCLLLAYLLPRLNYFDDLQSLVHRLPGIREKSPEYIASLHYFTESLGRQGGKLQYLLHTLEDRQETHRARSPGDLMYLAALASELGDKRTAVRYFDQALRLRPLDQRLSALRLQALMAANDAGRVLQVLEGRPATPENALEMGRVYLQRHQYEGAIAVLAGIPRNAKSLASGPDAAYRGPTGPTGLSRSPGGDCTIWSPEGRPALLFLWPRPRCWSPWTTGPGRRRRIRLLWPRLRTPAPPRLPKPVWPASAATGPAPTGILPRLSGKTPRMWNFSTNWNRSGSRCDPSWQPAICLPPGGESAGPRKPCVPGSSVATTVSPGPWKALRVSMKSILPLTVPYVLIPETTLLEDRNHIKGLQTRLSGSLWLSRVVPVQLALGYQIYRQNTTGPGPDNLYLGSAPGLRPVRKYPHHLAKGRGHPGTGASGPRRQN